MESASARSSARHGAQRVRGEPGDSADAIVATRFSRQSRLFLQGDSGTDARFPWEGGQHVVVGGTPEPNGVQGVAGSNPAVPIVQVKAKY
jgi:hypothetical protein